MSDIQFQKNFSAFVGAAGGITPVGDNAEKTRDAGNSGGEFARILQEKLEQKQQLTFSKHALQRMDTRQIQVTPQLMEQINGAVSKAREKGVKDALILSGQTAFIVNIPNSTVVTTISGQEMTGNIFTNIDGAVIL